MRPLAIIVCILVLVLGAHAATAQQPPRTLAVDGYPISIEFMAGNEKVADKIATICAGEIPRLADELGLVKVAPFRIYLIDDMDVFERAQGIRLPSWGVAFALMDNQLMLVDVVRATKTWNSLDHIVPHELSHLLLAQRIDGVVIPLWFIEGLALWQAREWSLIENWRLMEAVWTNRAPMLAHIHTSMPSAEQSARDAYRVSYTAITERFGQSLDTLPAFLDEVVRSRDFSEAFASFWNESEFQYSARFAASLDRKYKSRLLLFQAGPLFSIVAVLFLIVYIRIRIRNHRKLKQLDRIERGLSMDDYRSD
jgi:uncharacterized membrane protein YciS (DUF1049 family)